MKKSKNVKKARRAAIRVSIKRTNSEPMTLEDQDKLRDIMTIAGLKLYNNINPRSYLKRQQQLTTGILSTLLTGIHSASDTTLKLAIDRLL